MPRADTSYAIRHAHIHPGYSLVAWEPVAVPVYALTADLVLQQEKTLPPLDEYVLEAIAAGLDTPAGIEGLLGLEQHVVNYAVTKQIMHDYLVVVPRNDRPEAQIALTPLGTEVLETLRYTVPAREQYRIVFDRLLWQPIPRRQNDLMRSKDLETRELVRLPRADRRQAVPSDLRPQDVAALLNRDGYNGNKVDVLAVSGIVRQEARYLEAQVLVFVSDDSADLRFEVAIDGVLSPKHTDAVARDGRASQLPFTVAPPAPAQTLPGHLARICLPLDDARAANEARLRSQRHKPAGPSDGPAVAPDAADPAPVRQIETWEHRVLLEDAVASARTRLLVVTPGVSRDTVDPALLAGLERLLDRRVEVRILVGPAAGAAPHERDAEAAAALQALAREHPTLHVAVADGAVEPALVWDGCRVASAFDWLGHRSSRPREVRHERGVLVCDRDDASRVFNEIVDAAWGT